ncbi:hypothetical protein ACP4OV_025595 [Aristida adscensionis]
MPHQQPDHEAYSLQAAGRCVRVRAVHHHKNKHITYTPQRNTYLGVGTMVAPPPEEDAGAREEARRAGGAGPSAAAPLHLHADLPELVPSLPLETRCLPFRLRHYGGFWLPERTLRAAVPAIHASFAPPPTDVFLASYPKCGTTWLKALAFAALSRAAHPPSAGDHPLRRRNPHDCVKFLELELTLAEDDMAGVMAELEELPSPRVFACHLPHSMLPMSITEHCRIVYISRNPKDALVSSWLFTKKSAAAVGVDDTQSFTLQEAFELFCEGRSLFGPQWLHARQYWEASVRRPDKVLFLRYEEMLLDPKCNLKKLAKFMGCEFSEEEEEGGVVDEIVELCSLEKLKNVEVNKNGRSKFDIKNENFFRKGVAGDWANHMTPEMAQRLDKIVDDALQGSGLTFSNQG